MTPSERWLTLLLRLFGTAAILAIVAVFMPRAWIDQAHQALGFGPFPEGAVPEYLARYTSLFYVWAGIVHWWLSLGVRRYGRAIVGLGILMALSGMAILWIDIQTHMPSWWVLLEGPLTIAMGVVYLVLHFRSQVEVLHAAAAAEAAPEIDDTDADEADASAPATPAAPADRIEDPVSEPVCDERFPAPLTHAGRSATGAAPLATDEAEPPEADESASPGDEALSDAPAAADDETDAETGPEDESPAPGAGF